MYIIPTVTSLSNGSPVLPSYNTVFPFALYPAFSKQSSIFFSVAPSNTGVAMCHPNALAAQPKWTSNTWPIFIRDGTPSGFKQICNGLPSGKNGISSLGRILDTIPLLPWRPAILSPTEIFLFWAI